MSHHRKSVVAMILLTASAVTSAGAPVKAATQKKSVEFECGGFEPSSSLNIKDGKIKYGSPSIELPEVQITKTESRGEGFKIDAKSGDGLLFHLDITADRDCVSDGDGAKGKETHKIDFILDKESYSGCCKRILKSK